MTYTAQIFLALCIVIAWCLVFPPPVAELLTLMGIRPNQGISTRARPPEPRCRHSRPPVPVEVHDRLDGRPEIIAWLCPDCYDTTRAPLPELPPGLATWDGRRGPEEVIPRR